MSELVNNNQVQIDDLQDENQRLRQQLRELQQHVTQCQHAHLELQRANEELETRFAQRSRALQATESRLQRLAAHLPGVIFQFRLEPDGTESFPYVSEKSREIYEIAPDDFLQGFDLVYSDDRDRLQTAIQESAQTLNGFDCEYRITTPSGVLKWLRALSQPERQENGEILWDGIILEISDRQAFESTLLISEERFRLVCEQTGQLVYDYDIASGHIIWAGGIAAITGYSADEFQRFDANNWENLIHPDDRDRVMAHLERAMAEVTPYRVEYRWRQKEGDYIDVEDIGVFLTNETGKASRMLGTTCNISDRKAAEERLRQQEAQYRQVFETISDGLGIIDLERGQLVEVNPAYHQMHGYSYEEFLSVPLTDIIHPDCHFQWGELLADIDAGRVFTALGKNVHRDGQSIEVEVKGIPFPYQGKPHALGIIRDISEKVKLEQERDRQEQALRFIVEGTAAQTGEAFFRACVKSLAVALEVPYVLVAEIERPQAEKTIASVIASWMGTDFGENFQYDLGGTPCYNVFENGTLCRYSESLQSLFPDDPYLVPLNAESYVGIPLVDSRGAVVGLIAVLHTEPMFATSERQVSILEIFAARAGAEIERMRSEKALREKERILQLTLQAGKLGCWTWNQMTNEIIWSDGVEEILGLEANSFGGTFEDYVSLIHPEDIEAFQQEIEQALVTEREYYTEHRLMLPDGSIQWLRGRGEIWRDEQENAIGLLGSVLNDTQRKMAEIALLASTEQLQQQARQEQLLNQIANQIRTSLALDRILDTTVQEIEHFLEVDRCHFAWYVQDGGESYWHVIAEECHPDLPSKLGQYPERDLKALSAVLLHQQSVRVDAVKNLHETELREELLALGHQSMLALRVLGHEFDFGRGDLPG